MSIQFPQQQAPRRKSGGGLFFLILLGVGAFLIFSRMGNSPVGGDGAGQGQRTLPDLTVDPLEDDGYARKREAVFGPDKPKSNIGQKMPSTGGTGVAAGWEMDDDVATKPSLVQPPTSPPARPMPSKTQNDDWSMESVESQKPVERQEPQFKFSTPTEQQVLPPQNDWAMENVEPKPKTTKDDWSIE